MEDDIINLIGVQDGKGSADTQMYFGEFFVLPADHQFWGKDFENKMMILEEDAEHV